MKNCKRCGMNKICRDLPGYCIVLQMTTVILVVGFLGYLFVSQTLA